MYTKTRVAVFTGTETLLDWPMTNQGVKKSSVSQLGFVVRRVNNFTRILSYDLSLVSVLIQRQRRRLVLESPNRRQYLPHSTKKGKLDDTDTTVTVGLVY